MVYLEMGSFYRNEHIHQELNLLLNFIQDNQLDKAKTKLAELKKELPLNHSELLKAKLLLKKQEIRHAKNQ